MDASIVIRTYNEGKWLGEVLEACAAQDNGEFSHEVVIVDSGSTDDTLAIAEQHGARVTHIKKSDFTFGRSLNVGCEFAEGRFLVFISGHCIPVGDQWLVNLIRPLHEGTVSFTYGRQQGRPGVTKFSEEQLFRKYFPEHGSIPQEGFFCNNANSAVLKEIWKTYKFDEEVTGLEDMVMGKRLVADGHKIGYVADASVIHLHEETWSKVKTRYEREAIALQGIMPEVHIRFRDFIRFTVAGIMYDMSEALNQRVFWKEAGSIFMFRLMQYWGSYRGNNDHRKLSQERKDRYFYPR
ncbi:glycosyltransferase [Hyphobacterium sp.]|uniref:glycosyltransferase n=1 Tax=Hyphobacterium sp. TaxID=2004662 RepID=UPI003BACA3A5